MSVERLVGLPGMWRKCKFWAKGFGWDDSFYKKFSISVYCINKDERNFEVGVNGLIGGIEF